MIAPCECGAKLKIDDAKIPDKGVKVRCPRCGNVLHVRRSVSAPPSAPQPKSFIPGEMNAAPLVLIAHDSEVVRNTVTDVLINSGFRADSAADGVEALKKATEDLPQALVLDVGLPGIYGFELCERLKDDPATKGIKIILLSSVYDMRRYKRTPANLYGADDYIEKHHIPDFLPSKLRKLIFPEQFAAEPPKAREHHHYDLPEMSRPPAREFEPSLLSPDSPSHDPFPHAVSRPSAVKAPRPEFQEGTALTPESFSLDASIFQKEECDIPRVNESDPEAVEKARRFARIIVSDIALYNQSAVIDGIKNGTFFELLKTDIDEGRELYEKRVPAAIRGARDYYQEAFDNFISAAKQKIVH
jgi:predicted Zn finger-like uncharacterized protein